MVNTNGRFTSPWISRRCWSGSLSGVPEWLRSKCSPFGVLMPLPAACSGFSNSLSLRMAPPFLLVEFSILLHSFAVRHDGGLEFRAFGLRVGENGVRQVGAFEIGAAQIGTVELGAEQIDPREI